MRLNSKSGRNHLPRHDHVPLAGNYFSISIIRDAVNPASAIVQFKSHEISIKIFKCNHFDNWIKLF